MENASKALIIAGAILLSILIIGLGMFIYNQAADAMGNTGLNQQKADAHNRQFLQYQGVQTGATVKTLISTVEQYNISGATDSSEYIQVTTTGTAAPATNGYNNETTASNYNSAHVSNAKTNLRVGVRYNVTFGYDPTTGYVCSILVTQVNNNGGGNQGGGQS